MKKKVNVLVISGFSGAGKDYTISRLLEKNSNCSLVKSCTTRPVRQGDNDKYTYLAKEEFESAIKKNAFLEYNLYGDEYYGTPYEGENGLKVLLETSDTVIIEVDYKGMQDIKNSRIFENEAYNFHTIFIATSASTLVFRLMERKTEEIPKIIKRLETALEEADHITEYDYLVLNEEWGVRTAVDDIEDILKGIYGEDDEPFLFDFFFKQTMAEYIDELKERY